MRSIVPCVFEADFRRWCAGALAFGLLLPGCGSGAPRQEPIATERAALEEGASSLPVASPPAAGVANPTAAPEAVEAEDGDVLTAPSFPTITLTDSTGGQIDFGSLQGQDTVLWFWAPW